MLVDVAAATATPLDAWWRVFIAVSGLLICAVCLKVAVASYRRRDYQNLWSVLAFGLVILAPATSSVFRFDVALPKPFAVIYTLGLVCALVALVYRVRIGAPWLRFWQERERRQTRRSNRT